MQEVPVMIISSREYNYERQDRENEYGTKIQYYATKEKIDKCVGRYVKTLDIKRKYLNEELALKGLSEKTEIPGKLIIGYDYLTEQASIENITY